MEQREYTFAAGLPATGRALAGVVGSGDLEVLLQPHQAGITLIVVNTSVDGKGAVWDALLARVFGGEPLPAASIIIAMMLLPSTIDSGVRPALIWQGNWPATPTNFAEARACRPSLLIISISRAGIAV